MLNTCERLLSIHSLLDTTTCWRELQEENMKSFLEKRSFGGFIRTRNLIKQWRLLADKNASMLSVNTQDSCEDSNKFETINVKFNRKGCLSKLVKGQAFTFNPPRIHLHPQTPHQLNQTFTFTPFEINYFSLNFSWLFVKWAASSTLSKCQSTRHKCFWKGGR